MRDIEKIFFEEVSPKYDPYARLGNVMLRIGSWKKLFTVADVKSMIARGLNNTLHQREFRNVLVGYLITDSRLFLVFDLPQCDVDSFMQIFINELKPIIKAFFLVQISHSHEPLGFDEGRTHASLNKDLFEELPSMNYLLIYLLAGRVIKLPYTDPRLTRLQHTLDKEPFCSRIDYSGAKGPVKVKLYKPPVKVVLIEEKEEVRKPRRRRPNRPQ
ncbi:MAG: hypothetical protein IM638_07720 [Bacteroidetes bacterium]|nr:hypothetical protein [Bacteroidota bacterium]